MKRIFGCITVLISIVITSEQCLNPVTISPSTNHRRARFSVVPKIPELKESSSPESYTFLDVSIYTLNADPLAQYALLEGDDIAFVLQLNGAYKDASNKEFWRTEDDGVIEFRDFEETNANESHSFLKNYGMLKGSALREMRRNCEFFVLQKNMEKTFYCIMAVGAILLFYMVYAMFNFMVNLGTLRKMWKGSSILRSFFNALSQSLTNRQISKHHRLVNEKMYVNVYTKMNQLEEKMKNIESVDRGNMLSKHAAELEYDYVVAHKKNLNNNSEHNRISNGYMTPKNSVIIREDKKHLI